MTQFFHLFPIFTRKKLRVRNEPPHQVGETRWGAFQRSFVGTAPARPLQALSVFYAQGGQGWPAGACDVKKSPRETCKNVVSCLRLLFWKNCSIFTFMFWNGILTSWTKPTCCFFQADGCRKGDACAHCHFCSAEETRKKLNRNLVQIWWFSEVSFPLFNFYEFSTVVGD